MDVVVVRSEVVRSESVGFRVGMVAVVTLVGSFLLAACGSPGAAKSSSPSGTEAMNEPTLCEAIRASS
jgi:uncharacterized lipoprotein YajG